MSVLDIIKYDFIGFLTPEQRDYNLQLYGRRKAEQDYWQTRKEAALRVWYVKELKKYNFFEDKKKYTDKLWQEKDFFDFKKYWWSKGNELFYETVYKVIYSELLDKLGKEKLEKLRINQEVDKLFKDKMFFKIYNYFISGWPIEDLADYFSKFKNYKQYKKEKIWPLLGTNYSLEDIERINNAAAKGNQYTIDEKLEMAQTLTDLRKNYNQHFKTFENEFLEPLYEEYDKQMKLAKELEKSPLAKQVNEQNKLLRKQMGIEEEEPIFSFSDKIKK